MEPWSFILPEQRRIEVRNPAELARAPIPRVPRPPTVSDPQFDVPPRYLSLSDVINISLSNLDVVRVLTGFTAVSTGRTVYDVAITNTRVDQERANFDPNLQAINSWNRNETANGTFDPFNPIVGSRGNNYVLDLGLSKRTLTGGVIDFGVNANNNRVRPGIFPLNPSTRSSLDLGYTQPLLQGGGSAVNRVPIVLARIDTERSFFQYKSSIQDNVQSVIDGYWAIVFARTDLWVREQQVQQLEFANRRAEAALEVGTSDLREVAQTRVAYQNFRANLILTQANLLQREAAFRNVLGLPPYEPERIVPVSPLLEEKLEIDWEGIVSLAETQRPDIIELKLILEADLQRLLVSRNQASPRLDGVALYRWNGLEGTLPGGAVVGTQPGQFTDWNLGVNFSVPLGLRRDRALLRQQELLIERDRANLQQGLHQALHNLAQNLRNLEQFYAQYERFKEVREAAKVNLDAQIESYAAGLTQFIIVLQAVNDWGNAVSSEAQSLVQYNAELARLELATGTILEAHGIAFFEERYGSLGPLGRLADPQCYPLATRPTPSVIRYETREQPSEEAFNLIDPVDEMREDASGAEAFEPGLIEEVEPTSIPEDKPAVPDDRSSKDSAVIRAARSLKSLFR